MTTLTEVLKNADQIILTIETRLNNTAISEWGFEDWNAGTIPNCGLDLDIVIDSNAEILITAGQARNSGGSDVVTEGLQLRRSLGDTFVSGVEQSLGKLKLSYRNSGDALNTRDWDNRDIIVRAGGVLNGQELRYPDYPLFFKGVSKGYDFDETNMQVTLSTGPKELSNVFPFNTFNSGEARGEVLPVVFGTVRNYSPVDLGSGLYMFHDTQYGAVESVNAAYNNGTELVLEAGDPLTESPISGNYMTDGNYIKVNDSDEMVLTVDLTGYDIISLPDRNERIGYIVEELVYQGSKARIPVTWIGSKVTTEKIGWVIDQQKTLRQHLEEILTPHDLYFTDNLFDNGITIRRRYNGQALDFNGNTNVRNSFSFNEEDIIEGSLRRIKTESRPQTTTVLYDKNWTVLDGDGVPSVNRNRMRKEYEKTAVVLSPGGAASSRNIKTMFINETDAEAFNVQTAARDGARNQRYSMTVHGIGHNLEVGSVGVLDHFLLPTQSFSEIRQITENTVTRRTDLTVVIYG